MDQDRRTRLAPDERRRQLVALGVSTLVDEPLEALTIEQLAKLAGVSRGLLFYYFGSKQGLHREVVLAARDGMLNFTRPVEGLAPLERLHSTLTRTVQFVRDHSGTLEEIVEFLERTVRAVAASVVTESN